MNAIVKFSFFLLAFLAMTLTAQAQQCQTKPGCCSKASAKVEKQDKANVAQEEGAAKLVVNVTPAATERAAEVTTQLTNFITSPNNKNCKPVNCAPKNCTPANCDPAQCQPAECKKKTGQL